MNGQDHEAPAEARALEAAVRRQVRIRFALTAEAFAGRLRDRLTRRPPPHDLTVLALDDLYLAAACGDGDEDAWREFRDRFFRYIGDFAARFVPPAAAHDVRDQLIADLWQRRRLDQFDGRSSLRTWLGALVTHASINARRPMRDASPTITAEREPQVHVDRESDDARRQFTARVDQAIAALDAESKLLLLLYYEQGLTLEQIASVLGASKATLSRRLARTRDELRDALSHDDAAGRAGAPPQLPDLSRLEWDLAAALGWMQKKRGDGV